MSIRIAPSILSADPLALRAEVREIEAAGADLLHVDVMDGHFVPNLTFGPAVVAALRGVTRLPLDVHLMVESPDRVIPAFAEAGADIITVHVEATPHLHRSLQQIRALGKQAGVALNPATSPDFLEFVADTVDLVLVMTVNPGYGGQDFLSGVLPKVERVAAMVRTLGTRWAIEVDGGIHGETVPAVVRAGADTLVAGSAVFAAGNRAEAVRNLREAAEAAMGVAPPSSSRHRVRGTAPGTRGGEP